MTQRLRFFFPQIHPHAFVGMKNLHSLDLSHNRIASLSQAIFTNLRNLQVSSAV